MNDVTQKDTIKQITRQVKSIVDNAKEVYNTKGKNIVQQLKEGMRKVHSRKEVKNLVEKKNNFHKKIKQSMPKNKKEFTQMKWLKFVQKMIPKAESEELTCWG